MIINFVALISLYSLITPAYGAWINQEILIIGTWGSASAQFGFIGGDTPAYDIWPIAIEVFPFSKIFIADDVNKRTNIYSSDGKFVETVPWKEIVTASYIEYERNKYIYDGALSGFDANLAFWTKESNLYHKYDSSFTLKKTLSSRPLELGKITTKKMSATQWHYEIEFPDRIYVFEGDKDAIKEDGLLKVNDNLIMQNRDARVMAYKVTAEIAVQHNQRKKFQLATAAEWSKPSDEFGPTRVVGVERIPVLIAQYGNAVLASNGSIYVWMRTGKQYKILRWKWID